jgi:hypothetical protein
MNGVVIISLSNGLLIFSHTFCDFGLERKVDPMKLSSMLYALYALSTSVEERLDEINVDVISETVATSVQRSPLSYFQQVLKIQTLIPHL